MRLRQDSNLLPPASKFIPSHIQTPLEPSKTLFLFRMVALVVERMDVADGPGRLGVSP